MVRRLATSLSALSVVLAACSSTPAPGASPTDGLAGSATTPAASIVAAPSPTSSPTSSPSPSGVAITSPAPLPTPPTAPTSSLDAAGSPSPTAASTPRPTATPDFQGATADLDASGDWTLTVAGPLERGDGCVEFPSQPGRPLFIAVNGAASFPDTGDWSLSVTDPDGTGVQPLGFELQRERGTYLYTWESGTGEGSAAFDAAAGRLTLDIRLRDLLGDAAVDLKGTIQCEG